MIKNLSPEEIDALLTEQQYAHLGCSSQGEIYVVPITYVYEDGNLYSYTQEGKKTDMMRQQPKVCVQVEQVRHHKEWSSAICWGTFEEITAPAEQQRIRLLLADQFAQGELSNDEVISPLVEHLHLQKNQEKAPQVIYRIRVDRKTGKAEGK